MKPVPPNEPGVKAKGVVEVKITVSYEGEVTKAEVISGHPLLREAAIQAARQWRFNPMKLSNFPVMMEGVLPLEFK